MNTELEKMEYTQKHKERVQNIIDLINKDVSVMDNIEDDCISLSYNYRNKNIMLSVPCASDIFCFIENERNNFIYSYIPCHNEHNFLKDLFRLGECK